MVHWQVVIEDFGDEYMVAVAEDETRAKEKMACFVYQNPGDKFRVRRVDEDGQEL